MESGLKVTPNWMCAFDRDGEEETDNIILLVPRRRNCD